MTSPERSEVDRTAHPPLTDDDVVAVVGDACIDLYPASGLTCIGGNAPNVAVNLRSHGLRSEFVGRVGEDADGRRLVDGLRARDVIVERLEIGSAATCIGFLETGPDGMTRIVGTQGDCSPYRLTADDYEHLAKRRHTHLKEVADIATVVNELDSRGVSHSYDYSEGIEELHGQAADISFFSCGAGGDGERRAVEALDAAMALGARIAIATLGADGSIARRGDEEIRVPVTPTHQVDSIGAGDSYIAAVLAGLLRGESLRAAMESGATAGAATCRHVAAWPQTLATRTGH